MYKRLTALPVCKSVLTLCVVQPKMMLREEKEHNVNVSEWKKQWNICYQRMLHVISIVKIE